MIDLSSSSSEKIRTLGMYQPYASLMLHGKIETRWVKKGKKPPFPLGKYLIYSTKRAYSGEQFRFVAGETYKDAMNKLGGGLLWWALPRGCALLVAELKRVELWNIHDPSDHIEAFANTYVKPETDPEFDRWLLYFENVTAIKQFKFKGKQGIGFLKPGDRNKIEFI